MATIDRTKLITDAKMWLPELIVFNDTQLEYFAELVIALVGDDDIYYAEILCKLLMVVANASLSKVSSDPDGITKEKLGDHDVTYGGLADYKQVWRDFKDNLDNVCPLFGYNPKGGSGKVVINTGEKHNPLKLREHS